ncbi:hypothetical protein [Streptomyces lanatus]|uniref:DUF3592 domain-containing protein n=1 Tax=Streptomyces lanatus TaxID=66900 RepID=A0ABV1Y881_9ACTN|nr:hypothetical protein [Streptomyces lanatus]GHH31659.1 hypothetical protein GCM10018780_92860 [Streptomyces lanatus]
MTQVQGTATDDRTSLGRLIGAGLILVGLVLLALGAYLGPYTYATATPGKLTVDTCTVDYKYRTSTSSSSRKKTKTRWCYGTFKSTDGSVTDLNAELKSDALHQRGYVIEALKTGDTTYKLDRGWVYAIAVGCAWLFGALISLAIGFFATVTGFPFGQASGQGLFRTCLVLVGVGAVGLTVSLLVAFFA